MFSIVMPYYNNSVVVSRSIESVLAQSYSDYELIIIDDGSEDNILEIVNSYKDSRIKLIKQRNTGVSGARNKGINHSQKKFICFLDSDDEWLPNHLEILSNNILKYNEEVFFVTGHKRLGKRTYLSTNKLGIDYEDSLLVEDYFKFAIDKFEIIHTNSVCIKRSALDKVGNFEVGVNRGEDVDLWFRLASYFNVIFINEITTVYHRDYSYLTSDLSFDAQGIFLNRKHSLMNNPLISMEKRDSIRIYIDRCLIARSRKYIATGNKIQALREFNSVKYHSNIRNAYISTKIALLLPNLITKPILRKIYIKKIRDY